MDRILSLTDIRRRSAEVSREIDSFRVRLSELLDEQSDLAQAEEFVTKYGSPSAAVDHTHEVVLSSAPAPSSPFELSNDVPPPEPKKSLRDLVIEAMRLIPDQWTNAVAIQRAASELRGKAVPMGSISPTLTVLKDERLVVRNGMKIALAERLLDQDQQGTNEGGADVRVNG